MKTISDILQNIHKNREYILPTLATSIIIFVIISVIVFQIIRRIIRIEDLPNNPKNIKIKGLVTNILDDSTFLFYHIPPFRKNNYYPGCPILKIGLVGINEIQPDSNNTSLKYESKMYLKSLLKNKIVRLKIYCIDERKRLICEVKLKDDDGKTINASIEMVKFGFARVNENWDDDFSLKYELIEAENKAKEYMLGIWEQ